MLRFVEDTRDIAIVALSTLHEKVSHDIDEKALLGTTALLDMLNEE